MYAWVSFSTTFTLTAAPTPAAPIVAPPLPPLSSVTSFAEIVTPSLEEVPFAVTLEDAPI